jgi:IS605 OrfB family transposase
MGIFKSSSANTFSLLSEFYWFAALCDTEASRLVAFKAVAFPYQPDEAVRPLLENFRMMVNQAIWVGRQQEIRGRFKLIRAVYEEFKRYELHSHYTINACEVAYAILKNSKRSHRIPVAKRLFLKLDNQTYRLGTETLRIPLKPRQFLTLKLKLGEYQRSFLKDSTLKRGSITLTERAVIVTFEKMEPGGLGYASVLAYDTNELSLDGVLSNLATIRPIRADLCRIAKIRADHFKRRRRLQARLVHCQRKLNAKLASDREREGRRVDTVLHQVAKEQVNQAKEKNAKIVLENLKDVRRSVNRRVSKRNRYNGKLQRISIHSKTLKRRLNTWPFRRLHAFIEYKARWAGVPLSHVPAWNTSRTCAVCGCLRTGHGGEQDPKTRRIFQCPKCGWRCNRHLNAALNLLKTQDEGRWFSPDRLPNEVVTIKRAYGEEDKPSADEGLTEPRHEWL